MILGMPWTAVLGPTVLAVVAATCSPRGLAATPDEIVVKARSAASANRHGQAIEAFREALLAAPERRREWLVEYADQLTWSGKSADAVPLYREAAISLPEREQAWARIGLARALSWQGRHARALEEYETVLRADPGNRDAIRGAARVQSWRGRYRDAIARLEPYLRQHPHDAEAVLILAESRFWMGRSNLAKDLLEDHLSVEQDDLSARRLLGRIEQGLRTETRVDWRNYDQSDDLRIGDLDVMARQTFDDGLATTALRYTATTYRPPAGAVTEISVRRPAVAASYRPGDALELNGKISADLISGAGLSRDFRHLTHETWLTWWPSDVLRFDVSASRWTFDNELALVAGLVADQAGVSMDITPDDRTRLSLRTNVLDISDGNQRNWWQLELQRRITANPRLSLGYRYTGFRFSEATPNGYYSPGRYASHELLISAAGWAGSRFYWELRAAGGTESDAPGASRLIYAGSALTSWQLTSGLSVEAGLDHSSSRTTSTGGFARSIARLTMRYRY